MKEKITSKTFIELCKERFDYLKHRNFDFESFYNGFLEGSIALRLKSNHKKSKLKKSKLKGFEITDIKVSEATEVTDKSCLKKLLT